MLGKLELGTIPAQTIAPTAESNSMLSFMFRNRRRLNLIETQIIETIAAALPENASALLRRQIALINKVQRIDQDREVDFYRVEDGKLAFPNDVLFPNRAEEFELAIVHVTDVTTGHQTKASASLVKGRLFCIEFSHTPRDLRGSSNL